jgi:nickel-dependent lactate racemase
MEVKLAYGKTGVTLKVPDWAEVDRYGRADASEAVTYDDFRTGLSSADGASVLRGAPLIIINDGHRSTPTLQVLKWLDQWDSTVLDSARFLIACGTHGEPTDEHLQTIFGQYLDRVRDRLAWHDCHDMDSMVSVGVDHFGEQVYLNRLAAEAEQLIVITSVEPHYFAGFTGGRKSLFPGLTDMATIERNHNLANSLDCAPLRLKGNPMAEHLDEMLTLVGIENIFSIQTVVDADHNINRVFCGPIDKAFHDATDAACGLYANSVARPYDLLMAEVAPPLDRSLYQIQKALENCQAAVVDGGTAVVVAACEDGVGKRNFYDLALKWDTRKNAPNDGIPRFGSHKLSRVNAMTRRIKVQLYSELPPEQPRRVFYEPAEDLQLLVNECLDRDNRKRLAIVHDAGHTVLQTTGVS